jgi:hypothetical protein
MKPAGRARAYEGIARGIRGHEQTDQYSRVESRVSLRGASAP